MKKLLVMTSVLFFNACFSGKINIAIDLIRKPNTNMDINYDRRRDDNRTRTAYVSLTDFDGVKRIFQVEVDNNGTIVSKRLHPHLDNNINENL